MDDFKLVQETMLKMGMQLRMLERDICEGNATPEKVLAFALNFTVLNLMDAMLKGVEIESLFEDAIDASIEAMVQAGYKNPDGTNTPLADSLAIGLVTKQVPSKDNPISTFDDDAFLDFLNDIGAFDK